MADSGPEDESRGRDKGLQTAARSRQDDATDGPETAMPDDPLTTALDHLRSAGFAPGPDLEAAHAICQLHEGQALFDWLHALIHRIEGDQSNADYWYRRAGRSRHHGPASEEWRIIRAAAA